MSYFAQRRVLADSQTTGTARLLLMTLAFHGDEDGVSFPGHPLLLSEVRVSKSQLVRLIAELEASGELYLERGRGRGHLTRYFVTTGVPEAEVARVLRRRFDLGGEEADEAARYLALKGRTGDTVCEDDEPPPPKGRTGDTLFGPFHEEQAAKGRTDDTLREAPQEKVASMHQKGRIEDDKRSHLGREKVASMRHRNVFNNTNQASNTRAPAREAPPPPSVPHNGPSPSQAHEGGPFSQPELAAAADFLEEEGVRRLPTAEGISFDDAVASELRLVGLASPLAERLAGEHGAERCRRNAELFRRRVAADVRAGREPPGLGLLVEAIERDYATERLDAKRRAVEVATGAVSEALLTHAEAVGAFRQIGSGTLSDHFEPVKQPDGRTLFRRLPTAGRRSKAPKAPPPEADASAGSEIYDELTSLHAEMPPPPLLGRSDAPRKAARPQRGRPRPSGPAPLADLLSHPPPVGGDLDAEPIPPEFERFAEVNGNGPYGPSRDVPASTPEGSDPPT